MDVIRLDFLKARPAPLRSLTPGSVLPSSISDVPLGFESLKRRVISYAF